MNLNDSCHWSNKQIEWIEQYILKYLIGFRNGNGTNDCLPLLFLDIIWGQIAIALRKAHELHSQSANKFQNKQYEPTLDSCQIPLLYNFKVPDSFSKLLKNYACLDNLKMMLWSHKIVF